MGIITQHKVTHPASQYRLRTNRPPSCNVTNPLRAPLRVRYERAFAAVRLIRAQPVFRGWVRHLVLGYHSHKATILHFTAPSSSQWQDYVLGRKILLRAKIEKRDPPAPGGNSPLYIKRHMNRGAKMIPCKFVTRVVTLLFGGCTV